MVAFMPEPHTLLTVVAPVASGRPAPRAAWRAGAWPWPAGRTQPISTSSMRSGARVGPIECGADRVRAESRGGQAGQLALEAAERRARGGDDDDGIEVGHEGHSAGLRRTPIGRRSLDDKHHD